MLPFPPPQIKSYLVQCIEVAKQCSNRFNPPYVGALVVSSDGRILGSGHKKFISGTDLTIHAERAALDTIEHYEDLRTAVLFTTLEPCVPDLEEDKKIILTSCAQYILDRGIRNVIIGLEDCSEVVHDGVGIDYLRSRGVRVSTYDGLEERIVSELMPNHLRKLLEIKKRKQ